MRIFVWDLDDGAAPIFAVFASWQSIVDSRGNGDAIPVRAVNLQKAIQVALVAQETHTASCELSTTPAIGVLSFTRCIPDFFSGTAEKG